MSKRNKMTWDKIFKLEAAIRDTSKSIRENFDNPEKRFSMFQQNREAIEEYRNLKENVNNREFSISRPKVAYQYAEVRSSYRTPI